MHGVIVEVKIDSDRGEEAINVLKEVTVPRAKGLDGFASGTWLRSLQGDRGVSVLLFESEESAKAAAARIRSEGPPPGAPVTLENVGAFEVAAQA